ncbi:unnamed protein product [Sphenostylis stenocarpa]|uniref:Uncharacterized protein n=1 Tax=Sphenostylis stenocarpa TaxID=92480 RepID=A0AA86VJN6_9FABA|nr:unnamed protein product [Sphenostylis stenocarpa]
MQKHYPVHYKYLPFTLSSRFLLRFSPTLHSVSTLVTTTNSFWLCLPAKTSSVITKDSRFTLEFLNLLVVRYLLHTLSHLYPACERSLQQKWSEISFEAHPRLAIFSSLSLPLGEYISRRKAKVVSCYP